MQVRNLPSLKCVAAFMSVLLLVNLLMPGIAAATIKRDQFLAIFSVICTATGLKNIDLNSNDVNRGQSAPAHNQQDAVHCPLCVAGGASALPTQHLFSISLFEGLFEHNYTSIYPVPSRPFWHSVSPRGPPVTA
jgi:Protein of unknown function (DUF2946)